jgi:hypothetical protein
MHHTRIYYVKRGEHIHAEFYSAGSPELTHAKNGDLCFSLKEWASLVTVFEKFPDGFTLIDRDSFGRTIPPIPPGQPNQ